MELRKDIEEEIMEIIKDITLYVTSNDDDELTETDKLSKNDIKDVINAILGYKNIKNIIGNARYTEEYNIKYFMNYLMVLNMRLGSNDLGETINSITELMDKGDHYIYSNITYYYRLVELFTKTSTLIIKGGYVPRTKLLEMILSTLG